MRTILASVALVCSAALPALAYAQSSNQIEVEDGASYRHARSGTLFLPAVDEFQRFRIDRYGSDYDISATYQDDVGRTFATLYVTRVGTPDPYLWFHRVLGVIKDREGFEPFMAPGVQPEFFTAPGFDRPSGVRVAYATRGGQIASSGLAMMAYGDMIVKIRVSSYDLDRTELMGVMSRFIDGFSLPTPTGFEPDPYTVESCQDSIQFDASAVQTSATTDTAVHYAISESMSDLNGDVEARSALFGQYCHDAEASNTFEIYRVDGSKRGYLLSYNDTGSALLVGAARRILVGRVNTEGQPAYGYGVIHQLPERSLIFAPYNKLPPPDAVVQVPGSQPAIAATDRDNNISISDKLAPTPEE